VIGLSCFRYRAIPSNISTISMPQEMPGGKGSDEIFMLRKIVRILLWLLLIYAAVSAVLELMKGIR